MTPPPIAAPRILIADDSPDLLAVLQALLEREGYVVDGVLDGEAALDAIRRSPPDIAVLDWKMPKLDGFAVCTALREDPMLAHLPVVILSASATRADKIVGLELGADDVIAKPIDTSELLARIRMIMRRTRLGLDANPLTRLPGNAAIAARIENAVTLQRAFAVLYIDLNQFKSYNDAYGYDAGDRVIKETAALLLRTVRNEKDFIGHIGGDDFIIITTPERMEPLAKTIIADFDALSPSFYNDADRARQRIVSTDRQGLFREFPFLSVAIGICHNKIHALTSYAQVSQLGTELKKHAKTKTGSAYALDRRSQ